LSKDEDFMRNAAARYGGVQERLAVQMTNAQAMRLRTLSEEAYQPKLFEENLTSAEADRRIEILKAEIELANSF
jgi:Protein of unknown function (DUF3072)